MAKKAKAQARDITPGVGRWDAPIDTIFASGGETETIPSTDPTLHRLNITEGFSYVYSTKPSEGGSYVPRVGFNSIFNQLYASVQEIQTKTAQVRKGVSSQGYDYTLEWLPDGNILLKLWGAADLPAGSGSQAGGNDILIQLPYKVLPERSGYSVMIRPPAGSSGTPYAYITDQTAESVTFHTSLYSADSPIHYHIDLKFVGDQQAYPPAPQGLTVSVVETAGVLTWEPVE